MKMNTILWMLVFILSIGIVSAGNVSWSVPVYVVYNGQVTLYANDGYTNASIANFSAIVTDITNNYAVQYNSTGGYNLSIDIVQGDNYQITYSQPNYINATSPTLTFNTIYSNYTQLMNQTQVTILFQHAYSHQIINNRNITITDLTYNQTFNTTTGVLVTNMPAGGVVLDINAGANYIPINFTLTLTPRQTGTVIIDLFPILNLSIYDEKRSLIILTYFNYSNPKVLQYTIYCINSNQSISQIIPNSTPPGSYTIGTPCAYESIKFDLQYVQPDLTLIQYYRGLILPSNINTFSFDVFLVDISEGTPVLQTFLAPYDLFGQYTVQANTQILVHELMPSGVQLISSSIVDATGKVTQYLLQGAKYQITVMADGQPTKTLGNYYADQSGTQVLQLNNIAISTVGAATTATILANTILVPVSNTTANVQVQFYDPINVTSLVTLSVYNQTCTGTPLMSQSYNYLSLNGTQRQITMTYNVVGTRYMNGTTNQNFCARIDRTNTDYSTVSTEATLVYDSFIKFPAQFKNPWTFPWIVMLLLTVIAMGANFRTAPMVSLLIAILASALYSWNWFATGNIPGITASISLAVAVLLAIIFNIKRSVM